MLSKTIQNALNKQIGEEDYASHYYLSMASGKSFTAKTSG